MSFTKFPLLGILDYEKPATLSVQLDNTKIFMEDRMPLFRQKNSNKSFVFRFVSGSPLSSFYLRFEIIALKEIVNEIFWLRFRFRNGDVPSWLGIFKTQSEAHVNQAEKL